MTALRKNAIHASRPVPGVLCAALPFGFPSVDCTVEVFQEVVDQWWERVGWWGNEVGIQRMVRGTSRPVLDHADAVMSSCCPSSARAILWADGAIPSIREDAIASLRRRNLPMRTKSGDAFTARARVSA